MTYYTMFTALCELLNRLPFYAKCYLVGGCVRDALMTKMGAPWGFESENIKDFDVEVFGVQPDWLVTCLQRAGAQVDLVGASFGVYKVTFEGYTYDFSLPRRERKTGTGYTGFEVEVDPTMTVEEAAERRDLTINAIYYHVATNTVVDPFDGLKHLGWGILLHTSKRFAEDPLRVLRVMQFAARFDFHVSLSTVALAKRLLPEKATLTPERVWGEWEKWCLKSVRPSRMMRFLWLSDWMEAEIVALRNLLQNPDWHPEGTVWRHTEHVIDAAAAIRDREKLDKDEAVIFMLACLCHDFGKALTTVFEDGKWKSPGHEKVGETPTRSFLAKIGCPLKYIEPVVTLVKEHMAHGAGDINPRMVRRLVNRLVAGETTLRLLSLVVEADASGRPPKPKGMPQAMKTVLEVAEMAQIDGSVKVPALVMGRDLIALGVEPGPNMGRLLKDLYEAQLNGDFSTPEEGIEAAKGLLT
jgi:tRNA nucleotidyltransferase (CCA-adding enzyme)